MFSLFDLIHPLSNRIIDNGRHLRSFPRFQFRGFRVSSLIFKWKVSDSTKECISQPHENDSIQGQKKQRRPAAEI